MYINNILFYLCGYIYIYISVCICVESFGSGVYINSLHFLNICINVYIWIYIYIYIYIHNVLLNSRWSYIPFLPDSVFKRLMMHSTPQGLGLMLTSVSVPFSEEACSKKRVLTLVCILMDIDIYTNFMYVQTVKLAVWVLVVKNYDIYIYIYIYKYIHIHIYICIWLYIIIIYI